MKGFSSVRSPSLHNLSCDPNLTPCPACPPVRKVRLVIMGSSGVGKTALVARYMGQAFPNRHRPTVEELHQSEIIVHGFRVTLEVLDTSGTFEFPAMRRLAYDRGDAFLLVYALNDAESFELVRSIRQELQERRTSVPVLVAANKSDLDSVMAKEVTETVVRMDWEYPYVECSAKDDKGVTTAVSQLVTEAVRSDETLSRPCPPCPQLQHRRKTWRIKSLPTSLPRHNHIRSNSHFPKRHSCVIS